MSYCDCYSFAIYFGPKLEKKLYSVLKPCQRALSLTDTKNFQKIVKKRLNLYFIHEIIEY
jgi:hypothetical protein